MSDALGSVAGKAYPQPGGVAIEVDGTLQGSPQQILALQEVPGVTFAVAEDIPNLANDITTNFDGMRVLASIANINAFTIANTLLFTVPGGLVLVTELVVVRCTAAVGITAPPTAGVGTDLAASNIFGSQQLTGLTTAGSFYVFPPGGTQVEAPGIIVVNFGIQGAPVGTSMVLAVDLIGRAG